MRVIIELPEDTKIVDLAESLTNLPGSYVLRWEEREIRGKQTENTQNAARQPRMAQHKKR